VCCAYYLAPSVSKAPRILGFSKARSTANATSHALNAPVGTVAGELLLCIVSSDCQSAGLVIDVGTWDAGALAQIIQASNAVAGRAFYRTATGDSNDNVTISTSASEQVSAVMFRVVDAGGTPEWTTNQQTNTNTADPPLHTNTFGGGSPYPTLYLACCGVSGNVGPAITSMPSGYGPLVFVPGATTDGTLVAVSWLQSIATSENPGAFGITSTSSWSATLAIPGLP
jgi:hypothetical protein